jgi:hypothetical protein
LPLTPFRNSSSNLNLSICIVKAMVLVLDSPG